MDGRVRHDVLHRRSLGGAAAIPAFALALLLAGPTAGLTVPTGATLLGFAAALVSGGGDSDPEPDVEPPWWPSF